MYISVQVVSELGSIRPIQHRNKKPIGRKTAASLEAQHHALFKFLVKMNTVVLVRNTAKSTQTMPLYRYGADALKMPRTTDAGKLWLRKLSMQRMGSVKR